MTDVVAIVNRSLQVIGTRTTVTALELANETTNEAIQANLILENFRDDLLRMAPWDCAFNYNNLNYITSTPGTPENPSPATQLWAKGQPPPPWAYEYQYPVDCLRACWIVPATQTGFSGSVPITTAVTGGAAAFWNGPPVKHKIVIDQFYPAITATIAAPGAGYAVGEILTLVGGSISSSAPIGAGTKLRVLTIGLGGAVATAEVISQVTGSATPLGGSYFSPTTTPQAVASTTGVGVGATFTLAFGVQGDQRVIVTNQEFATLAYVKQVIDPNVMDTLFQSAWISLLGAGLTMALSGDKTLANGLIQRANTAIEIARTADSNEGLTVNDVTPDWIRARGVDWAQPITGPFSGYDWGNMWMPY